MRRPPVAMALAALLVACVARVPATQQAAPGSILARSSPAAGSTVRAEVDELTLHFDPPARLDEVRIAGPDGTMPMMVHAVGEVADYALPLAGLGPGAYVVSWRATARGREYRGSFTFTVT